MLALTILVLYRLNYRSAEGFLTALLAMMKIDLPVPDYTTLCRRMKSLSVGYRRYLIQKKGQPLDLVFDATGFKVYGRGECKTKPSDRFNVKNWKMLHLGMSPDNFQIRELEFSSCKLFDSEAFERMLPRIKCRLGKIYGDKAYLASECFNLLEEKGGEAVIDLRP